MILGNHALLGALRAGWFAIDATDPPFSQLDPSKPPFNTSALDLHLGTEIAVPSSGTPTSIDFSSGGSIAKLLSANSETKTISTDQPFRLAQNKFVLANTRERVDFRPQKPIQFPDFPTVTSLAARVEGKSSLARCGLLVHFTAPTIHAGFNGTITLEMINLGPWPIVLTPGMPICQLIVEMVLGPVASAPNQFAGQARPAGNT